MSSLTPPYRRTASLDRYERDRERVAGRHLWVSDDPDLAAAQLVQYMGPAKARRLFVLGLWSVRRLVRGERNLSEDATDFSSWCAQVADGISMHEETMADAA